MEKYVYVAAGVLIIGLLGGVVHYKGKYEKALKSQYEAEALASQFELSVNKQNELIEKLNKQVASYRDKIKTQRQQITVRFKKLNADNIKTCEDSLAYLRDLLQTYKETK